MAIRCQLTNDTVAFGFVSVLVRFVLSIKMKSATENLSKFVHKFFEPSVCRFEILVLSSELRSNTKKFSPRSRMVP